MAWNEGVGSLCSSINPVGNLLFDLPSLFWDESLKFWKQFSIVFRLLEAQIGHWNTMDLAEIYTE